MIDEVLSCPSTRFGFSVPPRLLLHICECMAHMCVCCVWRPRAMIAWLKAAKSQQQGWHRRQHNTTQHGDDELRIWLITKQNTCSHARCLHAKRSVRTLQPHVIYNCQRCTETHETATTTTTTCEAPRFHHIYNNISSGAKNIRKQVAHQKRKSLTGRLLLLHHRTFVHVPHARTHLCNFGIHRCRFVLENAYTNESIIRCVGL